MINKRGIATQEFVFLIISIFILLLISYFAITSYEEGENFFDKILPKFLKNTPQTTQDSEIIRYSPTSGNIQYFDEKTRNWRDITKTQKIGKKTLNPEIIKPDIEKLYFLKERDPLIIPLKEHLYILSPTNDYSHIPGTSLKVLDYRKNDKKEWGIYSQFTPHQSPDSVIYYGTLEILNNKEVYLRRHMPLNKVPYSENIDPDIFFFEERNEISTDPPYQSFLDFISKPLENWTDSILDQPHTISYNEKSQDSYCLKKDDIFLIIDLNNPTTGSCP